MQFWIDRSKLWEKEQIKGLGYGQGFKGKKVGIINFVDQ